MCTPSAAGSSNGCAPVAISRSVRRTWPRRGRGEHPLAALVDDAARTPLAPDFEPEQPDDDQPLYAARKKVYPQRVTGTFRRVKWAVLFFTLGIYYLLPFVRWDRGLNAPGQAVLIDFPNRRFYFFFIEIWPQEFYYLTGLLILAAMALFLMNAVAGRLWCGYLCPQTVWTDLFQTIERWTEGDRREHLQRDRQPWTLRASGTGRHQALSLADGRLVDRRRLGSLLR